MIDKYLKASFRYINFILFFLLLISYNIYGAKLVFSDGFESGDFSSWTNAAGGVSVTDSIFRAGKYGAKVDFFLPGVEAIIINLGAPPDTAVFIRYYMRLDRRYHWPYLGFKWLRLKHGEVDGIQAEHYVTSESGVASGSVYQSGKTHYVWWGSGQPNIADDIWHKIEIYVKYNIEEQANGIHQIWWDDIQILNKNDAIFRSDQFASQVYKMFFIPSNAGDATKYFAQEGDIIYIDDVQIWDGYAKGIEEYNPPTKPTGFKVTR